MFRWEHREGFSRGFFLDAGLGHSHGLLGRCRGGGGGGGGGGGRLLRCLCNTSGYPLGCLRGHGSSRQLGCLCWFGHCVLYHMGWCWLGKSPSLHQKEGEYFVDKQKLGKMLAESRMLPQLTLVPEVVPVAAKVKPERGRGSRRDVRERCRLAALGELSCPPPIVVLTAILSTEHGIACCCCLRNRSAKPAARRWRLALGREEGLAVIIRPAGTWRGKAQILLRHSYPTVFGLHHGPRTC